MTKTIATNTVATNQKKKKKTAQRGRPSVYHFDELEIGKSRHIKLTDILKSRADATEHDKRNTVAVSAALLGQREKRKFKTSLKRERGIIIVTRIA